MAKNVYRVPEMGKGMVTNISPLIVSEDAGLSSVLKNVDISQFGFLRKRPGIAEVLGPTAGPITGACEFIKSSTEKVHKVVSHGTVVQAWNPDTTAWVNIVTGLTSGKKVEFLTFADSLLIVNGEDASVVWDGTSDSTPAAFPVASYLTDYRLRVAAAGDPAYPTMLHLSHTGDPTLWDPEDPASNAAKIFISPDDGEHITGIINAGEGGLFIGKRTSIYGLFGYARSNFTVDLIDPNVGVASHRSLVYFRPHVYFVSELGIFRLQIGDSAERISFPIQGEFDSRVNFSRIEESSAVVVNRTYVVTLPTGATDFFTLAYNIDKGGWSEWTLPYVGSRMNVSDSATSKVYVVESGSTQLKAVTPGLLSDFGANSIDSEYISIWLHGGSPESDKDVTDIYVSCKQASVDYKISVAVRGDTPGWEGWQELGEATVSAGTGISVKRFPTQTHATTRFLEVRIKNEEINQDFMPMGMTFVAEVKELT